MGVANVLASLEAGVRTFDSSIAGLGGCPYSPGYATSITYFVIRNTQLTCSRSATGNVATEDILYAIKGSERFATRGGAEDALDDVAAIGWWISERLGRETTSRVGRAIKARKDRDEREQQENDKDQKAKL
jgi:hydroxymethylglutaryl-CoA lyase